MQHVEGESHGEDFHEGVPEVLTTFALGQDRVVLSVGWDGSIDIEGVPVWRHDADAIVDDDPGSSAVPVKVEFAETGDAAGTGKVSEGAG